MGFLSFEFIRVVVLSCKFLLSCNVVFISDGRGGRVATLEKPSSFILPNLHRYSIISN